MTKHHRDQWWLISLKHAWTLTHAGLVLPYGVGSTLYTATSHYLSQCWPQKQKGGQVDSLGIHWRRWGLSSTSPVYIRAVILTTFPFQYIYIYIFIYIYAHIVQSYPYRQSCSLALTCDCIIQEDTKRVIQGKILLCCQLTAHVRWLFMCYQA